MNILIFQIEFGGHFNEYIRHINNYVKDCSEINLTFVITDEYKEFVKKDLLPSNNISINYISSWEIRKINEGSFINRSWNRCRLLRKYLDRFSPQKLILLWGVPYLPWLGLFVNKNIEISTIEYLIPGWRNKPVSLKKQLFDNLKLLIYSRTKNLKNVFLLNDTKFPLIYNEKYNCNKFNYLPDPIEETRKTKVSEPFPRKIILLHAGCIKKEKGTFDILDAIYLLPENVREKFKLIICGKSPIVDENSRIIEKVESIKSLIDTEFYNSFVSDKFLNQQYNRADYVLIPYYNYSQSSGNLGHAAAHNVPVIGPAMGLLGKLIIENGLGLTLAKLTPENISKILVEISKKSLYLIDGSKYVDKCSPRVFAELLLN